MADHTGKTPVKKQVNKGGKTHEQTFWVNPNAHAHPASGSEHHASYDPDRAKGSRAAHHEEHRKSFWGKLASAAKSVGRGVGKALDKLPSSHDDGGHSPHAPARPTTTRRGIKVRYPR